MLKNYRNELESILDKKNFSKEVKNLLLSMEYKIETAYDEYAMAKRNVDSLENILKRIIKTIKYCNMIEFIEVLPEEERYIERTLEETNVFSIDEEEDIEKTADIIKNRRYEINFVNKSIKVYPNEIDLLDAILCLEDDKIFIKDEYKYYRTSFANTINSGRLINNIEIIRDFDAWNWNKQNEYIENFIDNLIYQNLTILLGYKGFEEWRKNKKVDDNIKNLTDKLEKIYGKANEKKFLDSVYILSIIEYTNKNLKERYRIVAEKEKIKNQLDILNDKIGYVINASEEKKKLLNRIEKIDIQLNNYDELQKNYFDVNESLSKYFKLRNISQYQRKIEKERKDSLKKIRENNEKILPKNYIDIKNQIEENYKYVESIEVENVKLSKIIKYLKDMQFAFLNSFQILIKNADTKKEIMELVYIYRYYLSIPCTHKRCIKDLKCIRLKIVETEKILMEKLYDLKALNIFTKNNKIDCQIFDIILNSSIISLEKIKLSIVIIANEVIINLYDSNIIEKTLKLGMLDKDFKQVDFKENKKYKIFNK